ENSTDAWESNKQEILELLRAGKNVAFLTIGDPMFYSTYIYVFRLLENEGVEIQTIPGIPAFAAIGSQLGYPIVEGDDVLSIIAATASPEKVENAMQAADNVVLMKVYKNFEDVADLLDKNEMAEQAVLVSRAGLDDEKIIYDVLAHKKDKLNYLSTILTRKK
ncbi:MAG: precorrin-2 C(20)-methyltransferase, partial [Selenomonas sp.]|nr:precorrin-2 C(20)-methyltransferase [Selenomonas sp.]